jgi:excisionase family DNA binding protein
MTAIDDLSDTRLYTPEEAAARLGVTANWMNQKAREGRIPDTPMGRTRMFSAANIRAIIAGFANEPTANPPRRPGQRATA